MLIKISDVSGLHEKLVGEEMEEEGYLSKPNFVELNGRYFCMNRPLKFGFTVFERDHQNYNAAVSLVGINNSAFKGVSKVFSDALFTRNDLNCGGYFHSINSDGAGYLLDSSRRVVLAISQDPLKEDDSKFPARQLVIGESGAINRFFKKDDIDLFLKEISWYQDVVNLFIDSIYSNYKAHNPRFFYDSNKRIIITPSI